ncbi:tetrahydromethanopterin S-methyltransferase subunit MtrC [Methanimicrococcus blatticola]|uniref:Tetrahydromethanopterin S-methyltransferase subunit C n=1 Tax=Methanimicrococcus blatticola TaxID=91560 RepID=A0A484F526_9EURY|nr:tetrahydromethanopterin S-methyltransferase subunit C [Methanimicrococcus blatticola]MBZ3936113.1 tetrahydromethanopterin S-methyltransferase subunit C [Methanimicrococcus blatticola]MCC2508356.1 tetrahydromethanopterin S-methyltransferase subunit C [Methanimicrococcus blatticola]TDQ70191.1 tetrahydromethanopterin S-methyltransferase subunit C [Methanimicrococcus blatticola]
MNPTGSRSEQKTKEDKFFLLEKPALEGLLISLLTIYAAVLGGPIVSFTAGVGMVFAIIWAADAVRKISKYGLGTGVPSVGMFGIGLACIISIFAVSVNAFWSPMIGVVLALVIGWISGKLINKILGMNIPSMEKRIAEITAGCTLAMIASFIVIAGTLESTIVFSSYILTGISALGFIGIAVAVFHAYNANLGPDEAQDRTKMLTVLDALLLLLILGIAAFFMGYGSGATLAYLIGAGITIFMSIAFILISFYKFWTYVKRDAWQITETGLLPSEEDLN